MFGNAGTKVTKSNYRVCCDRTPVGLSYSAWEALSGTTTHVCVVSYYGSEFGLVGHKYPPLSVMEKGSSAVRAFNEAEEARAYDAILEVYPEAASGDRHLGAITVVERK